jgi:beta-lactamase regulating signal transducer with metallopeptidase domain
MTMLLAAVVDASVVLSVALVAVTLLRRQSAALRHAILASAIVCAILMPAFELVLPQQFTLVWPVADQSLATSSGPTLQSDVAGSTTDAALAVDAPAPFPWLALLAGLWALASGTAAVLLLRSLIMLRRIRLRAMTVGGTPRRLLDGLAQRAGVTRRVELLQADAPALLVTYGSVHPRIILPADTADWSDDRWRVVFQHELAHIRRGDAGMQLAGEVLRVLQPFNPLVWITCRRLRHESELSCDDDVLRGGVKASDYATHLLDVARHLSTPTTVWAAAAAIAHPSTLERRIIAMLHTEKNRAPLSRRGWLVAAVATLGVSLPLAAAGIGSPTPEPTPSRDVAGPASPTTPGAIPPAVESRPAPAPRATQQTGTIAGRALDQSGGTLPGVTAVLTNNQSLESWQVITNPAGVFNFGALPPATYELELRLSGFRRVSRQITLASGAAFNETITLEVGAMTEEVTVRCGSTGVSLLGAFFPTLSAQAPSTPIRVGGQIREPKKLTHVNPTCPATSPGDGVVAILEGTINTDGLVVDLTSLRDVPAEFVAAARTAVEQWVFSPVTLNGQPVAVKFTVVVNFTQ